MKKSLLFCLFILGSSHVMTHAQTDSSKNANTTVSSLDSILFTLYDVISGEKGEARDWELLKFLFKPDAKLIPSGKDQAGVYRVRYMTPQDYIDASGKWLVENGFYEEEINRKVEQFGNIAHVFSTYQCFHSKTDTEPFMRGINSIQLLNEGDRWRVINIFWQQRKLVSHSKLKTQR